MNWKRAALAAGAGAAGAVVICAGLFATVVIALAGFSPIPGSRRPDDALVVLQLVLMLTIPPPLLSLGGALPARALGVRRWRTALAISLVAHVITVLLVHRLLVHNTLVNTGGYFAAAFIPAAVLTVLLTARYSDPPVGIRGSVAVLAVAAAMVLLALLFGQMIVVEIIVGVLTWILLPAILTLSQSWFNRA